MAIVDAGGSVIAWYGEIDRPFLIRSAAKPFQAMVANRSEAKLTPLQLALAASSHDGDPVHIAIVSEMLAEVGLDEDDLGCPPAWPLSASARDRVVAGGATAPRPIWNNCSGKHAAFLRACVSSGWDAAGYLDPDHVLQREVAGVLAEWSGVETPVPGVDGCGFPVAKITAMGLARLFARLAIERSMAPVFEAMHRYPSLVSGTGNGDALIATALDAAAKRGAEGCLGVALAGGIGIGVKAWDGLGPVADVAAVAALDQLGMLTPHMSLALAETGRPPLLGGGGRQGALEPRLVLAR